MPTSSETKRPNVDELRQWSLDNEPSDDMRYKQGYFSQIGFMSRELFQYPFWNLADNAEVCKISVIGTHRSKSIVLPVVKIEYEGRGLSNDISFEMIASYNFHMWSITIRCNYPIPDMVKSLRLFDTTKSCYCFLYGFSEEDQLGCYDQNQREFSCTINDVYELWTLMRIISTQFENIAS